MHLSWTHLPHAVHYTKLDITLVPHSPQGSILLSNASSSISLTINFVVPRLTLIPLLSNASLQSLKFSLNSSIVSPLGPNLLHKEFALSSLSLHFPILHLSPLQAIKTTTQILGVHQLSQKILLTAPIQL